MQFSLLHRGWINPGPLGCGLVQGALHRIIQVIPNYPLMSCICFFIYMSIYANKPLFWAQEQYFCFCMCFSHKKALQIIPNISCVLFTFSGIGSSCFCMSEMDGLGQPKLWMTFGNWCSCTTIVNNHKSLFWGDPLGPTDLFVIETTSESLPYIYFIMFWHFQIVSLYQISTE